MKITKETLSETSIRCYLVLYLSSEITIDCLIEKLKLNDKHIMQINNIKSCCNHEDTLLCARIELELDFMQSDIYMQLKK